jgi:hypothetical protein
VIWAKEQIEYFGQVYRRQVYTPSVDQATIDRCHKQVMSANKKHLRDVGLDFAFLLESVTKREAEPAPASFAPTPQSAVAPTTFANLMASRPGALKVDNSNYGYKNLNTAAFSPMSPDLLQSAVSAVSANSPASANSDVSLSQGSTKPLAIRRARNASESAPPPPPRSSRRSQAHNML